MIFLLLICICHIPKMTGLGSHSQSSAAASSTPCVRPLHQLLHIGWQNDLAFLRSYGPLT